MKISQALTLVVILALVGCATTTKMNSLSVGMTKQEVVSAMGPPSSTAAPGGGVELLRYQLQTSEQAYYGGFTPHFVRLIDGRVDSYGQVGDFDSTKDPTLNLNIKNR